MKQNLQRAAFKKILMLLSACVLIHAHVVRDDEKEVVRDTTTKLMWQDNEEVITVEKTWADANSYCQNLSLGGYRDWFLPTVDELLTISDTSTYPSIQKGFENVEGAWYWSSSPRLSRDSDAWRINLQYGYTYTQSKMTTYHVRCARDSTGTSKVLNEHKQKLAKANKVVGTQIHQTQEAKEQKSDSSFEKGRIKLLNDNRLSYQVFRLFKEACDYEKGLTGEQKGFACESIAETLDKGFLVEVSKDEKKGFAYHKKACDLHSKYCGVLGESYLLGRGTAINRNSAEFYLRKACLSGDNDSCRVLKQMQ